MPEQEKIFTSKVKSDGIFNFKEFYKFCYEWLTEETNLDIMEDKYEEKVTPDGKDIKIKWVCTRKITDYFKFEIKVEFEIKRMTDVEIQRGNAKEKTNKGSVKITTGATLIRDYDGKFEHNAYKKFLRSVYEKWVIAARIDQYETRLIMDSDEFLAQAKAFLELSGKKA